MGDHNVELELDERMSQAFMKALLDDLRALDFMIETNRFETGVWRIGAEQEMFLVDSNMRPSPISQEVLSRAKDSRLTTEIARFNLEANLTPLLLTGQCLSEMERELLDLITKVRTSAARFGLGRPPLRNSAHVKEIRFDVGKSHAYFSLFSA